MLKKRDTASVMIDKIIESSTELRRRFVRARGAGGSDIVACVEWRTRAGMSFERVCGASLFCFAGHPQSRI